MSLNLNLPKSTVQRPSLNSLAVELHHLIYNHLDPVAKIALILTCRHFYRVFAHEQPEWRGLDINHKLQLLTIFERDSNFNVKMAHCITCNNCQFKSSFTPPEKKKEKRQCWRHSTVAYFSPDLKCRHPPPRAPTPSRCTIGSDPVSAHTSSANTHVRISLDILTLPKNRTASKEQIGTILRNFNLPVCPHTWLSHPIFVRGYNPHEKVMIDNPLCDLYNTPSCCDFPTCRTSAHWCVRTNPKRRFWKIIYINIIRHWAHARDDSQHALWTTQLVTLNGDRLDRYWNEQMKWKDEMMALEEKRYEFEEAEGVTDKIDDADADDGGKNGEGTKVQRGFPSSVQLAAAGFFNKISGTHDGSPSAVREPNSSEAQRKLSSHNYEDLDVLFWSFRQPEDLQSSAKFEKAFREANGKGSWFKSLPWT